MSSELFPKIVIISMLKEAGVTGLGKIFDLGKDRQEALIQILVRVRKVDTDGLSAKEIRQTYKETIEREFKLENLDSLYLDIIAGLDKSNIEKVLRVLGYHFQEIPLLIKIEDAADKWSDELIDSYSQSDKVGADPNAIDKAIGHKTEKKNVFDLVDEYLEQFSFNRREEVQEILKNWQELWQIFILNPYLPLEQRQYIQIIIRTLEKILEKDAFLAD